MSEGCIGMSSWVCLPMPSLGTQPSDSSGSSRRSLSSLEWRNEQPNTFRRRQLVCQLQLKFVRNSVAAQPAQHCHPLPMAQAPQKFLVLLRPCGTLDFRCNMCDHCRPYLPGTSSSASGLGSLKPYTRSSCSRETR